MILFAFAYDLNLKAILARIPTAATWKVRKKEASRSVGKRQRGEMDLAAGRVKCPCAPLMFVFTGGSVFVSRVVRSLGLSFAASNCVLILSLPF